MNKIILASTVAVVALAAGNAFARDQIRIVGSSTVFPFTSSVAEHFAQGGQFKAPIVESTGTGGGMQLFCAGVGEGHPDFTNASRAIKASEFDLCAQNGVTAITEIKVGYDGLTFAQSKDGIQIAVTKAQLFQALAKEVEVDGQIVANPYTKWSDIDASLPNEEIEILGPPPTSGTRDSWVELVMAVGCNAFPGIKALADSDAERHATICETMREDGRFIEAGENDNLIVQRLEANPAAFGIFGYSFLEENIDRLNGVAIEGVVPTFETVASGEYKVARPLFIYVKDQHVGVVPGMAEFIAEYTSERALGEDGYLGDIGLVTLPEEELATVRAAATALTPLARPQ